MSKNDLRGMKLLDDFNGLRAVSVPGMLPPSIGCRLLLSSARFDGLRVESALHKDKSGDGVFFIVEHHPTGSFGAYKAVHNGKPQNFTVLQDAVDYYNKGEESNV